MLWFALCLCGVSCARFTPPARGPEELPVPAEFTLYDASGAVPERWWEVFQSDELNRLIERALTGNLSLQQVYARLIQAEMAAIQAGAFWQDDRPVYFTGVGHFGQVRKDIPILNDYGLNIIQIEMGPQNGLPAPDRVDVDAIRANVVHCLDLAAAHNVAVNLLISPHYFPQWAKDADPAHSQCGEGFLKFCIEAPNTRPVMATWLDALMPLIAGHPALHSICLSNEPQYRGKCAYERALFQAWLKEKWQTIERANEVYGTQFRGFEEVDLPADASCGYGLFFDGCRFNQERFLAFHEMLRDRIHRYDPDLPVHAKVMSHAFEAVSYTHLTLPTIYSV
mgnify:CR=1 FL=1